MLTGAGLYVAPSPLPVSSFLDLLFTLNTWSSTDSLIHSRTSFFAVILKLSLGVGIWEGIWLGVKENHFKPTDEKVKDWVRKTGIRATAHPCLAGTEEVPRMQDSSFKMRKVLAKLGQVGHSRLWAP